MSSELPHENRSRSGYLWIGLVLLVLVGAGGAFWSFRFGPGALDQPVARAARSLLDTSRKRALTDAEFGEALAILGSGNGIAQLSAIAVIQLEVERKPERRDRAVVALEECREKAEPSIGQAAGQAADRLRDNAMAK